MRVETKPKTVSKLRTLIGNFRNSGGGMVQSVINYILGIHCTLDTTNFDKNLDNTIIDCQKLADRVDELILGDELPTATENQTLRKGAADWEANDKLKSKSTINWSKVPFAIADTDVVSAGACALQVLLAKTVGILIQSTSTVIGMQIIGTNAGLQITNASDSAINITGTIGYGIKMNTANATVLMWFYDGTTLQFQLSFDGSITATKFYRKNSTITNQYNNLVCNKDGKFEKDAKNICYLNANFNIVSDVLVKVPLFSLVAKATNIYHLEFKFILKRLTAPEAIDVFGNSHFQFKFTNENTLNEIEFIGGVTWREEPYTSTSQYSSGDIDCLPTHNHKEFDASEAIQTTFPGGTNNNIEYMILRGEGIFIQNSVTNEFSVSVAKLIDNEDYQIIKGSFMKITLKNED